MRLCIVPMKPLARAKERLADALDAGARKRLSLAMLADVVAAARGVHDVWVVCSDDEATAVAEKQGAASVADPTPSAGLNASLNAVTATAIEAGYDGLLVLSADCPATTADDVRALSLGPGVAIAPDRTGRGTNALWRMPPAAIPCVYGGASRRAHESLAHVWGVPCAVVPLQRVALDVDTPRDLEAVARTEVGPATRAVLEALGYPSARR